MKKNRWEIRNQFKIRTGNEKYVYIKTIFKLTSKYEKNEFSTI